MTVEFSKAGRLLIVIMNGDLDHCSSEEIRYKIEKEYKRINAKNILFDFSNVNFMDSSGIGMIIGRYKKIEINGGKVAVTCINENIRKIFEMSGLFKIIENVDDKNEAIKKFSMGGF